MNILDKIKRLFRKPKPRPPAVIKSVKSGDWNDPSTWDIGQVPGAGDSVCISEGHTVIYEEPEQLGEVDKWKWVTVPMPKIKVKRGEAVWLEYQETDILVHVNDENDEVVRIIPREEMEELYEKAEQLGEVDK